MTHMITIELLNQLNACEDGIDYFKREHGEEATLHEVLINEHLIRHHADWLGQYLPAEYLTWKQRLGLQLGDEGRARFGRHCPAGVEGATWDARLALQCHDYDRMKLGIHCPAGVEGATWEVRLALQCNAEDRAWFGRFCPAGVEGATWEARLALQRDGSDRALLGCDCPVGVEGATLEARLAVQRDEWGRDYVRKHFGGEHDTHDND